MQRILLIAGALTLTLSGFFIGRITTPVSESKPPADSEDSKVIHRGRRLSNHEYQESPAHPANLKKPGGIKSGIVYVLDEIDPIQRSLKIHQLLEHITADNWQELVEGMILSNGETGRNADYQLRSIITRVGQVDGRRALEEGFGIQGSDDYRNHLLYGWAMTDPQGAWEWAKNHNQNHPENPIEIYGSAFGGLTRANPESATRILNEMPDEEWHSAIGGYVRNLVRSETLDGTDLWLKDLMTGDRPEELKKEAIKLVSNTVNSSARNLRPPSKIADWYQNFGQHADDESHSMAAQLVRSSGERSGSNAAQLLGQLSQQGLIFDENQLIQITANMAPERRAEAHAWLLNNNQPDLATWFTE